MKQTKYSCVSPTTCMAAIIRIVFLVAVVGWTYSTAKRLVNAVEDIRDAIVDEKGTPTACAIGTEQAETGARK